MSTNIPQVQNTGGIRMAEFVRITENQNGDYEFILNPTLAPTAYPSSVRNSQIRIAWTDGTYHYFISAQTVYRGTQTAGGNITWEALSSFPQIGIPFRDDSGEYYVARPSIIGSETVIPCDRGTILAGSPAAFTRTQRIPVSRPVISIAGTASRVYAVTTGDLTRQRTIYTATSVTGTYTQTTIESNPRFVPGDVRYAAGLFVFAGATGAAAPLDYEGTMYFYTSTDGTTWTERSVYNPRTLNSGVSGSGQGEIIADYVNGRWLVFGTNGTLAYSTDNGASWTSANLPTGKRIVSVQYLTDKWVVLTNEVTGTGSYIYINSDLSISGWTQIFPPSNVKRYHAGVVGNFWTAYGSIPQDLLPCITSDLAVAIIPPKTYTFSNSYKDEVINGQLFSALGGYLGIAAQQRSIRATSYDLSMSIGGLDPANIYRVLLGNLRGSTIEMWRGFYDSNLVLQSVVKRYTGTVTSYSIDETNENQNVMYTITINSSNYKVIFENNVSGRKTNGDSWRDPKFNNIADTSMDNVKALVYAYFDFGKKK